jgi:hypothetical protein
VNRDVAVPGPRTNLDDRLIRLCELRRPDPVAISACPAARSLPSTRPLPRLFNERIGASGLTFVSADIRQTAATAALRIPTRHIEL